MEILMEYCNISYNSRGRYHQVEIQVRFSKLASNWLAASQSGARFENTFNQTLPANQSQDWKFLLTNMKFSVLWEGSQLNHFCVYSITKTSVLDTAHSLIPGKVSFKGKIQTHLNALYS